VTGATSGSEGGTVLRVTQVRSAIGTKPKHRGTLRALGLGRIGRTNELPDRPEIRGMVARVPHLVTVEDAEVGAPAGEENAAGAGAPAGEENAAGVGAPAGEESTAPGGAGVPRLGEEAGVGAPAGEETQ
jgi:large subunit ribosomal protein L30